MNFRLPTVALTLTLGLGLGPSLAGEAAPAGAPSAGKVLATALGLVPAAKDAPKELALKAGESIVAIGDSITAGGGYLRDIDAVLAQQYPELKTPKVINAGVSGQKAEDLIKRFEKDVVARKPAVVTVSIGINDVWHRLGKPADENVLKAYKENLAKMVDQAQAANIKVILLAPTVIKEDPEAEGNKRLPKYVEAMGQVAAEKKCQFVDLHNMFLEALKKKPADAGKGNWLTGDGVHMNATGNAIMAIGVLRALGVPDAKITATNL
jgi:acyl-CoA thioesterase-1